MTMGGFDSFLEGAAALFVIYWLMASGWHSVVGQTAYILLATAGTYLLARISWVLVEQPFLRLKKR